MVTPALEDVQRAVGDHYEVLDLAGAGGMGAVFRARHRSLGHLVAVKVLPPEIAPSAMLQERFRREASLAAHLSHPNIVPVYEFDTREGITFLIMPYVRGTTLETVLSERRQRVLAPFEIRRVLHDVGAALHFAHQRGVVHRDVKPSNILLEEDTGRALLTDFGIAHIQRSLGTTLTVPGQAIGTPDYMAPEQLVGLDAIDGRADLYSLALVAFEALTGTRPSLGTDRRTLARALRAAQPELSAKLAAALVAPLAEKPADRPASVEEWLALVERAWSRPRARLVAAALALPLVAGVAWLVASQLGKRPVAPRSVAVMPFAVLGANPNLPAGQLPTWFVQRMGRVPNLEALAPARLSFLAGGEAPTIGQAESLATQLRATYFVQPSVEFRGPRVKLTARLYETRRAKPLAAGERESSADSLSDVMDAVWAQALAPIIRQDFARVSAVTLPHSWPAIQAYSNAEEAFRVGDYERALAEYDRVITSDSSFALAYFRRALTVAQIAPTEANLRRELALALAAAEGRQAGLAPADSALLDGYRLLFEQGDGRAALDRFTQATELAPDQSHVWFVLGEYYLYFGTLFDQSIFEAERAFGQVLDLVPRFAPAIANSISLAHLKGDDAETQRLIAEYRKIDSTSLVAEVVGIADTVLFHPAAGTRLIKETLDKRRFTVLEYLAFQAAQFATPADSAVAAFATPRILKALERRAATDYERTLALRMGVAADLGAGRPDSARARLNRAVAAAAARERDRWILLAAATGLPPLGDPRSAAERVSAEVRAAGDSDVVGHWLLARIGRGSAEHGAALDRLAEKGSPLARSLGLDLEARRSLARGDTADALRRWETATQRYDVLGVPFDLVASLWPLRLELVRVAFAGGDTIRAERFCASFAALMGYVDRVARPEIARRCAR